MLPTEITKQASTVLNKLLRTSSKKVGLAPGTVIHVGRKKVEKTTFHVIDYGAKNIVEKNLNTIEETFEYKNTPSNTWIDIIGIHEVDNIVKLGNHFELHPLIQEDIANTNQRPSFEDAQKYLFMTLKMLSISEKNEISSEQVSLVIGKNFVISFQEKVGDVFDNVRKRIQDKRKIVGRGCDYLAYALIDAIVDNYFLVLESLGEQIEVLDDELTQNPTESTFRKINRLKRDLIYVRKQIWPLREVLNQFKRVESTLIHKDTIVFINDVYDHAIQIIDTIESLRDVISSMSDLYLSSVSNKMNEIMKVLTIFAAIFIPLTFIAGVYGMNFQNMPELGMKYGYHAIWGVFIIVGFGMFLYFRKQKWL